MATTLMRYEHRTRCPRLRCRRSRRQPSSSIVRTTARRRRTRTLRRRARPGRTTRRFPRQATTGPWAGERRSDPRRDRGVPDGNPVPRQSPTWCSRPSSSLTSCKFERSVRIELGDQRWRDLLQDQWSSCGRELERFGGREVDTAGDASSTFDGPTARSAAPSAIRARRTHDPPRAPHGHPHGRVRGDRGRSGWHRRPHRGARSPRRPAPARSSSPVSSLTSSPDRRSASRTAVPSRSRAWTGTGGSSQPRSSDDDAPRIPPGAVARHAQSARDHRWTDSLRLVRRWRDETPPRRAAVAAVALRRFVVHGSCFRRADRDSSST